MTKIRLAIAAVFIMAISLFSFATPAYAAGGTIKHFSPDQGYNAAFLVRGNGWDGWIPEGQTKAGVTGIYIPAGEQVKCTFNNGGTWFLQWDATGWHNVGDNFAGQCVNQLD